MTSPLYVPVGGGPPMALFRKFDDFGVPAYDLVRPPGRLREDRDAPILLSAVDGSRVRALPMPLDLLSSPPADESVMSLSRRTVQSLHAWWLVAEDPQRRLEAKPVATLAHQASLVRHVLDDSNLERVLIADEVGLGKTIEAGLIVEQLLAANRSLRVLYLAPSGLVANVHRELTRLGLDFRIWISGGRGDARLTDQRVIASIHRAIHPSNFEQFLAAPRWDILVVDECHHLSDWARGGGKPVRRFKLVDELRQRLAPDGRLLLLSGTPHQGHAERFENLVRLLRRPDEPPEAIAGRVIYRTKEDVRDWEGRPLFPRRRVNEPIVVDLGPEHRAWLSHIHELFEIEEDDASDLTQARRRAVGWRCGQALQWATSSVEAGLGFLVRQALRAGWEPDDPSVRAALALLRPYRNGATDEPVDRLADRIHKEIRRQEQSADIEDLEDMEDEPSEKWQPDGAKLRRLLEEGCEMLRRDPHAKWAVLRTRVLEPAGREKIVLFAQPIETVTALAGYLESISGHRPAMIIGNQGEEERARQVEMFLRPDGPQYLVSSRAGGEGLNLQVARRLVHVDVPWNPMELEQRVGRVHRFMSRRTILVDTLVVKDSREVDAYAVARAKLDEVARTLGHERPEELIGRVMALVPPEELQEVLTRRPLGPLNDSEREQIGRIVSEGLTRWKSFHDRFAESHKQIRALPSGEATWADVDLFVREHLKAVAKSGFSVLRFDQDGDDVIEAPVPAHVLDVDGQAYVCGDYGGMPVTSEGGERLPQLGCNVEPVTSTLRAAALPPRPAGAAFLRLSDGVPPSLSRAGGLGLLAYARQGVRVAHDTPSEGSTELFLFAVSPGDIRPLAGHEKAEVARAIFAASARREPNLPTELMEALRSANDRILAELRTPSDADRSQGMRFAVFPIAAIVLG